MSGVLSESMNVISSATSRSIDKGSFLSEDARWPFSGEAGRELFGDDV